MRVVQKAEPSTDDEEEKESEVEDNSPQQPAHDGMATPGMCIVSLTTCSCIQSLILLLVTHQNKYIIIT